MNEINKQINVANRRLMMGSFFRTLCWSLFGGLLVAAVAFAIPKIWHLEFLNSEANLKSWYLAWAIGGVAVGILTAAVLAFLGRQGRLKAAVEVDERFRLKERLSSALALTDEQRETRAGKALIDDAVRRAESIDVQEQFPLKPTRNALLPLLPAALLLLLLLVPNAEAAEPKAVDKGPEDKKVKVAIQEAKKKLQEKLKEMKAKGLKDASAELKSLEKKIDNLSKDSTDDKRDVLVKLNDVKKQLEERRKQLGGDSKEMKKQLNQLKEVSKGPAKELADAISESEFEEAKKSLKDLVDKLKAGKMSEVEKKQLAKDMNQIANEIKKMVDKHQQEKQELEKKIQKALDQGDLNKAAKLQQQLDKKKEQDQQMDKMKKMADKMKNCADCMKPGDGKSKKGQGKPKQGQGNQQQNQDGGQQGQQSLEEAIESLEDMAEALEQMQQEMGELEDLEDMMEQIEQAKNGCNGCEGGKDGPPKWQDWAKGGGRGGGKRDKQEEDTGFYKSRVKGKTQQGETVVTGSADGNNITGKSISEAREIVKSSMNDQTDPLENQKLPRSLRDHAHEYFKELGDK